MVDFPVHDDDSVPEAGKELYAKIKAGFGGFVPNVVSVLADSPAAMEAYTSLAGLLNNKTKFSTEEVQVLAITISSENGCEYCVAAHSTRANSLKIPADVVDALRDGGTISDPKLAALSTFARTLVRKRGWVDDGAIEAFLAAGYERSQVLDVVLAISWKTLSNYVNHMADTPLDTPFEAMRWEKAAKVA